MVLKLLKYALPLVFRETGGIPVCVTSAKYKKGIGSLVDSAISTYQKWNSRVPTPTLNRFIYDMQKMYPPPSIKQIRKHGRWVRYRAATPSIGTLSRSLSLSLALSLSVSAQPPSGTFGPKSAI